MTAQATLAGAVPTKVGIITTHVVMKRQAQSRCGHAALRPRSKKNSHYRLPRRKAGITQIEVEGQGEGEG